MSKGLLGGLVLAICLCSGAGAAQAAAPPNDNFAAATPLAPGQQISSTTLDATAEPGEPNPAAVALAPICKAISDGPACGTSVWYVFQPTQTGEYTIETCDLGTDFDTVIAVFKGATIGAEPVVENDDAASGLCAADGSSRGSQVTFAATAGTAYHVLVAGFSGYVGSFYLRSYAGAPQSRPVPDTGISRYSSIEHSRIGGAGVGSAGRQTPSFPLESASEGAAFECSLDGSAFSPCASPISYEGIRPGDPHVFQARAVLGGIPDPSPVVERFTVDTTPPETSIVSGPSGATASQKAAWRSSTTERENFGITLCSVDGSPPIGCGGPETTIEDLCQGQHSYRSASIDLAANVDPTPATVGIAVTTGPPCAAPTIGVPTVTTTPTSALVKFPSDNKGAGGFTRVEYGATAAYGSSTPDGPMFPALPGDLAHVIPFLVPGTLYHYRVVIATPFGTATSEDKTFTTQAPAGTMPVIQTGTPTALAPYSAGLRAIVDPNGVDTQLSVYISAAGPVTLSSTSIFRPRLIPKASAPQAYAIDPVDLAPGTTYRYRFAAYHTSATDSNAVLGEEGTFTTPEAKRAILVTLHFKLRKKNVKLGRLTRRSSFLRVLVKDLPADTVVRVKLVAGKRHVKARKKAKASGRVRFKIKLAKKVRKALHDKKLKRVKIRITASPPGDTTSSITLKPKLKR